MIFRTRRHSSLGVLGSHSLRRVLSRSSRVSKFQLWICDNFLSPFCVGFDTFIPFTKDTFVTAYIALPTFVLFYGGYKLYYRTVLIPSDKVDLITGKREIDEEEERFNQEQEARGPRSRWQRIWEDL